MEQGATLDELSTAIKESLFRRGTLGSIRASLRAEIFDCLTASSQESRRGGQNRDIAAAGGKEDRSRPRENVFIDELVREYLLFNGLVHTASVMAAEGGSCSSYDGGGPRPPSEGLDREIVKCELGIDESDGNTYDHRGQGSLPLLYGIVSLLKKQKDAAGSK